jgi:hypothetical protein
VTPAWSSYKIEGVKFVVVFLVAARFNNGFGEDAAWLFKVP